LQPGQPICGSGEACQLPRVGPVIVVCRPRKGPWAIVKESRHNGSKVLRISNASYRRRNFRESCYYRTSLGTSFSHVSKLSCISCFKMDLRLILNFCLRCQLGGIGNDYAPRDCQYPSEPQKNAGKWVAENGSDSSYGYETHMGTQCHLLLTSRDRECNRINLHLKGKNL
jgi:hypothetical protein